MTDVTYRPIGVVRSPFTEIPGMPLQPPAAPDVEGRIELEPEYAAGLLDLDGFSHVWVLAHLHRAAAVDLQIVPFLDTERRGVFATRSPGRPNPIGVSVLRVLAVQGSTIHVAGVDLLDGTPVLDVKPYVPQFDHVAADRIGWFEGKVAGVKDVRADPRFERFDTT
jgi:tRNA-Thr(GGU) m(6)t(6)A37 methyltransferase TsaA